MSCVVGYRPLRDGEIRLVDLDARGEESVLIHAHLDRLPEYTAVSYCWGDENCLHRFLINGQALIVTSSVLVVFTELQRRRFTGKVWVDAVCINQHDVLEKVVQIPLMGAIYSRARKVFAWLGPGCQDNVMSNEFITKIAGSLVDGLGPAFEHAIDAAHLPSLKSRVWHDLIDMITSPYFDRLWTFQEVVIASNSSLVLGFGRATVPWPLIVQAQRALSNTGFQLTELYLDRMARGCWIADPRIRITNMDCYRSEFERGDLRLGDMFYEARAKRSANAEDKVFALVNLASPAFRGILPVTMNASVQSTFIQAAKAVLKLEPQSLLSFSVATTGPKSRKLPGIPSWAPDLTTDWHAWRLTGFCGYNAGHARTVIASPRVSSEEGDNTLALHGFHLDSVETIWSHKSRDIIIQSDYLERKKELNEWLRACVRAVQATTKLPDSQIRRKLGRTIVCDRPYYSKEQYSIQCSDSVSEQFQTLLALPLKDTPFAHTSYMPYHQTVITFALECSIFITKTGCLGLGPLDMKRNDLVVVLYGGEVPFVVRKRPSGPLLPACG